MHVSRFTYGALTGMFSVALAVPVYAQISTTTANVSGDIASRPVPTQECLVAMAQLESAHLAHIDDNTAQRKLMMQQRIDGLNDAAAIADDTERAEKIEKMHEAHKDEEEFTVPDDVRKAMDALKEACGDMLKFRGRERGSHEGHGPMMKMMHKRWDEDAFFDENVAPPAEDSTAPNS